MCKDVLPASMSVYHMHAVPTEARGGASDLSELELQKVLSLHMGVRNRIWLSRRAVNTL